MSKLTKNPWKDEDKIKLLCTETVLVYRDRYPVTEDHLLFVPITEYDILDCFTSAYRVGYNGVLRKDFDGFNIGLNYGKAAGQTVMYPHVHLIPRRDGDMEDPRGGVRGVIPEKQKY